MIGRQRNVKRHGQIDSVTSDRWEKADVSSAWGEDLRKEICKRAPKFRKEIDERTYKNEIIR